MLSKALLGFSVPDNQSSMTAHYNTHVDQNPGRNAYVDQNGPKRDEKTDRHTRIFVGQRRMVILCRPELVLFPTCCCVIMFRLVCCFRYSWCVARLMRAGRRPDWPRRKPFRTKYPYHRLASFESRTRKQVPTTGGSDNHAGFHYDSTCRMETFTAALSSSTFVHGARRLKNQR